MSSCANAGADPTVLEIWRSGRHLHDRRKELLEKSPLLSANVVVVFHGQRIRTETS